MKLQRYIRVYKSTEENSAEKPYYTTSSYYTLSFQPRLLKKHSNGLRFIASTIEINLISVSQPGHPRDFTKYKSVFMRQSQTPIIKILFDFIFLPTISLCNTGEIFFFIIIIPLERERLESRRLREKVGIGNPHWRVYEFVITFVV